ncbi:hypothetical protein WMF38_57115 [Sorangium sp. So ce118]
MIDWDLSDEQMREAVVTGLTRQRDEMTFQADREERALRERTVRARDRAEAEACARYSRRQAAHYQQAIDLLTKAEMPEVE